jgi:NAD(P)H-flavin reductase
MLRYIHDQGMERNIILIWGNKTEQDMPSRDELDQMAEELH